MQTVPYPNPASIPCQALPSPPQNPLHICVSPPACACCGRCYAAQVLQWMHSCNMQGPGQLTPLPAAQSDVLLQLSGLTRSVCSRDACQPGGHTCTVNASQEKGCSRVQPVLSPAAATAADENAKNAPMKSKAKALGAPNVAVSAGVSVKIASAPPALARPPNDTDHAHCIATLSVPPTLSQGLRAQAACTSVCLWVQLQDHTGPVSGPGVTTALSVSQHSRQYVTNHTTPKPHRPIAHPKRANTPST